ncbi:hypothetical protein ABZ215_13825 [Amycolatopsis sp. NPDC006131]|uniref:hypothetical protein n=1 Tax=Amycolatopsis sp. NPDC006131 TaxID=3156731 RepID=UPI0033B4EEB1
MTTVEATKTSDELLAAFDRIVEEGKRLPLDELKKRYKASDHFQYRDHLIFKDVIELPVTVAMVTGETSGAVNKILGGLRELYGEDLDYKFEGRHDEVRLTVRRWREEKDLREQWKDFAEAEYKTEMYGGER